MSNDEAWDKQVDTSSHQGVSLLDTNHGYAKEQVVNSELAERQGVLEGRVHRLEHLAQASRARLMILRDLDQQLQEQLSAYEQQWMELSVQVMPFEATGQTEERDYFPVKARQLATEWKCASAKPCERYTNSGSSSD